MKKHFKTFLKIAVSVGLIAILLTQIDIRALGNDLVSANRWWLLSTFLLFASSILLRAERWKILLDALGLIVPFRLLSQWYFIGAFFNTLLPTGFGGDVIRTVYLAQYTSEAGSAAGTVILDRFLGILVLLALGVVAIPFAGDEISIWISVFILVVFFAAAGGFWLLRQERWVRWIQQRLFALLPLGLRTRLQHLSWIKPLYVALQGYDRRTLTKALFASLVFNLVWILVNVTAGLSLGVEASLVDYLVFVPLVSLALLLPSFGGIGVRELSYVGLFTQIGVPAETAFAMSVIIYAVTVATGLIGGLMLLLRSVRSPTRRPHPHTQPIPNSVEVADDPSGQNNYV